MANDFDPTDYGAPVEHPLGPDADAMEGSEGNDPAGTEKQLRDALLFVVDCSNMEPLSVSGRPLASEAFAAAANVLKTKVITSPDDRVGVVLYGVREKQNPNDFEGIRVLQELERPSAQRIRQLEQEMARTPSQFEERYGHNGEVPLSDVFWTCTTIFHISAIKNQFHGRVFLFTSNDAPCKSLVEQDAAGTRAQDLLDAGHDVEFFPLQPRDGVFSIEKFWGRVLPVDPSDYIDQVALRVEELERRVRRRLHRKRTLQRITLEVCPNVEVAISVFVNHYMARVPYPVYLLNESNTRLKSETRLLCAETGSILHPEDDVDTYVELAGQRVYISRSEMGDVKRLMEPGMRLLGVKSASKLRAHHRIFHSYFVYPNDNMISGSAAFCSALIERLVSRKQVALAQYVMSRNSQPVIAALVPQAEVIDSSGVEQLTPPGFHMILLPWGEEIRDLKFPAPDGSQRPSPELLHAARAVITDMRLDGFTPGCVENPVLQKHFAAVQALALGEDRPEETPDMLQADAAALAEKGPLLLAWRAAIDAAVPYGKRVASLAAIPGDDDCGGAFAMSRPPKVARLTVAVPSSIEEMKALVQSGEVERLTVPVLKDWLKAQGIACSGKKGDLLERVRAII